MNWYSNYTTYTSLFWFSSYNWSVASTSDQIPITQTSFYNITTTQIPINLENVPVLAERLPSTNNEPRCLSFQEYNTRQDINNFNRSIVKYPHRVALGAKANYRTEVYLKDRIWFCGGTLISDRFVLTAANCLTKLNRINISVEFVSIETNGKLEGPEQTRYKIVRQFPHPLHNPPSIYHDIALLELERPVELNDFVKPACLYVEEQIELNSQLKTTGWQLAFFGTSYQEIQEANLHLVTTDECESTYKNFRSRLPKGIIEKVQICAAENEEDTCKNDPGSPLEFTVNNNNDVKSYIVGIKSFGNTCHLKGIPGIYIRISPYVSWIESIVRNHPQINLAIQLDLDNTPTQRLRNSTPTTQLASSSVSEHKCLSYREDIQAELRDRNLVNLPGISLGAAGGVDATEGEFPHMAALGYSKTDNISGIEWQCGGSLISEKFILTAAHCLKSRDLGPVKWAQMDYVTYTYSILQNPEQVLYKVARRIPHPLYKRPLVYHDIALLELDRPVEFNSAVRPACLYTNSYIDPNVTLIATGWGLTEYGEPSVRLQKVDLDIFTDLECNQSYEGFSTRRLTDGIVNDKQICAGKRKGIQDTCQGDSGGALQFKTPGYEFMQHVVGIVSFGKGGCGLEGSIGVYTRVAAYVPWIESIVWPVDASNPNEPQKRYMKK